MCSETDSEFAFQYLLKYGDCRKVTEKNLLLRGKSTMKKNYFKKSLSLIMTVVMLMTCWVFVAPTEADAATTVSYPLSIQVNNQTKLHSGGNIQVYYYEVNSNGTLNTSTLLQYNFVNSLTTDKGAKPTYTGTIPGFPVKIAVTVANYGAGTDKMGVQVIKIGTKTIFNDNYTIQDKQTINWEKGVTLGSWNPNGVWENPSWSHNGSIDISGEYQVPVYGSRSYTFSNSYSVGFLDQYGVAWPQANITYKSKTSGVTANYSSGSFTGITVSNSALSLFSNNINTTANIVAVGPGGKESVEYAVSLRAPEREILFDNLFSFTGWYYSDCGTGVSATDRGTVSFDVNNATVTFKDNVSNTTSNDFYTNYGFADNYYKMDVKGNTEYVLSFDASASGGQCYVFYYTSSGACSTPHQQLSAGSGNRTFTTPSDCTKLGIRFGSASNGAEVTFSNIALYEADSPLVDADAPASKVYTFASTIGRTLPVPTKTGYTFQGWYLDADNSGSYNDGDTLIADGNGTVTTTDLQNYAMTQNWTLKSLWEINKYTVTYIFVDSRGTVTETYTHGDALNIPTASNPANSNANQHFSVVWDKAFVTPVTGSITYKEIQIADNHSWGAWSTVKDATCTETGTQERFCTVCNYRQEGTIAAKGHSYVSHDAVANDCGNEGNMAYYTCSVAECKDLYFLEKNGVAVDYDDAIKLAATGIHNYKAVAGTSTGNNEDDKHTEKCTVCSAERIAAHSRWTVQTTQGNCVTETIVTRTCACGATRTESQGVNSDNHKGPYKTEVGKVAATCTDDGYTGDKVCTACKAVTVKGKVDPKLGHSFTNYVYQNDATCFADGNEIAKCDRCDETHTRVKADSMLKHVYKDADYVYNNDAKCGVDGTETALCANGCSTENTRTAVGSARAHKFDGAVMNNEDGTHSFECSYDDCDVYSEGIPCSDWAEDATAGKCKCTVCGNTKAHAWGEEWFGSEDNGNAAGTMYRVCTDCNAKEEAIPCVYTSEHKDATCLVPEITTYTCKDCGHGYTVRGQAALGHDFNGGAIKSFSNGYHAYMCVRGCNVHGVDKTVNAVEDCAYDYENTGSGTHKATCTVCNYSFNDNCSGGIATCTDQAVCQYCNTKYGTTSDHVYTGTEKYLYKATEATCIANETYYFYCLGCEQTIDGVGTYEKPDTMLPHDYTCDDETLYLATYAKCGVDATYYYYCSNTDCKKSSEGTDKQATFADAGSALNHEFGGAATSNNDGTHTLECQQTNPAGFDCKETADYNCVDTAKLEAVNPATCTEAGYNEYICQLCDYEWTTTTDAALGHEYTEQIKDDAHFISAADCENGTVYWYDCAYCDKNAKDEDDASYTDLTYELDDSLGHNFGTNVTENGVATPATCTSAAKYYYACSRCSELDETRTFFSGESLGHNWAEIEAEEYIAVRPDCVTDAKYYKVCDRTDCGVKSTETWTKENSKSGHSLTHTAAKAATCDEAGNHAYWYCSTCKIYFKNAQATEAFTGEDATIIKKRAHDKVAVSFKNPTCLEDGHPAYEYCKYEDCNYTTLPEVLDNAYKAKGHNFAGVLVYDADLDCHSWMCLNGCGAKGMIVDGAQVEFKVEGNTYEGAVACEFTNYVAKTTDGIHSHALTCECGNESSKIYTDEETKIETVAATCTEDGYDAHVCPDCKATWKKNIVKSEGHKWSDNYVSNGDGTHSRVCSACNDSKETARCSGGEATCLLPAVCEFCKTGYGSTVDHKYTGEWTYVEGSAKCGVDGKETNACDVCKTPVERTAVGTALDHKMSSFGYADILPEGWDAPDFDESELKAPTCKDFGLTISYCENEDCGYYETRLVYPDETLHTWGAEYPVGDCSTGVSIMQDCTKCGIKKTLRVETDEHDWVEILKKAPTCEANGYMHFKCSKCNFVAIVDDVNYDFNQATIELGKVTIDVASLLAKGHTWGNEIVDKAPTCGLTGRAHKICSTCQKVDEYKLDATGNHTLTTVSGCPATCDSNGFESYKDCIVCSYSETAKVIPAKGHADNDGNGKCDGCNDSMDDILAKKDGCICHKNNGFMKFIYSILRFFWKLFKMNKTCACGAAHY